MYGRGSSNYHGNASAYNGNGTSPADVLITGVRLGGEHWWYLA